MNQRFFNEFRSTKHGRAMMSAHRGSQTEVAKGQFTLSLLK